LRILCGQGRFASGIARDSQDTLEFSALTLSDVHPMIEKFALSRVAEACERMHSGKARFRACEQQHRLRARSSSSCEKPIAGLKRTHTNDDAEQPYQYGRSNLPTHPVA
jgi:argininosuccinate lyase